MSTTKTPHPAVVEDVPQEVLELVTAVNQLPAEQRLVLQGSLSQVVEASRRRRRILHLVQEALGQLRLDMKYLLFDLEATRRERDDFRRQLEGDVE